MELAILLQVPSILRYFEWKQRSSVQFVLGLRWEMQPERRPRSSICDGEKMWVCVNSARKVEKREIKCVWGYLKHECRLTGC